MNLFSMTGVRAFIGAAVVVLGVSGMAMGEMLFSDTFDTSTPSSNVNFEIDSRTGGTYGGSGSITYNAYNNGGATKTVGYVDDSREVLYFNTPYNLDPHYRNYAWLDHNFNNADSAGGLDVDLTAKILVDDSSTGYMKWFAIAFANSSSAASDDTNRPLQHGLTFSFAYNGTGSIRENNTIKVSSFTWMSGGSGDAYHDFLFEIRGVDDDNPFDGVNKAEVKVYVDGSLKKTYTTTAGFSTTNNYIGLEVIEGVSGGASTEGFFDDLSITQIPEPSTLALLAAGLIGLLAYAWRKRK